jgi:integrase
LPTIDQIRDKWVRAVATKKPQEDFWDGSRPGLFLRVTRSGSKSFFFSYRRPGFGPVRERAKVALLLGKFAPDDPRPEVRFGVADAVAAYRSASGRLAEGVDPKPPQAGAVPVGTVPLPELHRDRLISVLGEQPLLRGSFAELAMEYLSLHAWVEKRRTRDDEAMLVRDLLPAWRNRPAAEIREEDVVAVTDRIVAERGARVSANHVRLLASRIYNFAISRAKLRHNPAHLVKVAGGKAKARQRWLADSEIRTLWFGLGKATVQLRCQIRLELVLMQRPGEVAAMEWAEVGDDRWWIIPGTKEIPLGGELVEVGTKNKLSHSVYLPSLAWEILEFLRSVTGGSRFVVPSPKRVDQPLWFTNKVLARLAADLGMQPFTRHDLRRTGTTSLQRLGFDHLVDPIVNHQPRGVRASYNLWQFRDERRRAMEAWDSHLRSILGL